MPSNYHHIAKIAREFWSLSRTKFRPGCDIAGAVNLVLPIDIISLSDLSLSKLDQWLSERGISASFGIEDRLLHGFLLSHAGRATMFINGTDTEEEKRYTVAHEASHFILDYKAPRDKAIAKLGLQITEVLDGYRKATLEERVDGLLASITLQPYTHLLEKFGDGSFSSIRVYDAEVNADALAIELLAPQAGVVKSLKTNIPKTSFPQFQEDCKSLLINNYCLPESIAKEYSFRLTYLVWGPPSILDKLGL